MTALHFLQALGYSSLVMLPLYLEHLGASRSAIGAIMASAAVGGVLFRPLVGWVLDAVGRRPTLIVGTVLLSSAMGLIGLVDRIGPLVYVARVLYGIGVGATFTGYFTFASDIVPEHRRTEGLALFGASGLVPLALVPLVRENGVSAPDLVIIFPIVGVLIALSLPGLLMLKEPERARSNTLRPMAILRTLWVRRLWPVWAATAVFSTLVAIFIAFGTVTAERRGVSMSSAIWFSYAVGAIAVRLFGARIPDRIGPSRIVAPAVGFYIAAAVVAAVSFDTFSFLVAGLLAGIAHGYCFPVLTSQVVTRMPGALRGSGIATFTALWELSALVMTPIFGFVADLTTDGVMFLSSAVVASVGLLAWAWLERKHGPVLASRARRGSLEAH